MASKRHERRRGCEGKVRHPSAEVANRERKRLNRVAYSGVLNVYHCRFCKGWHIGHQKHWNRF